MSLIPWNDKSEINIFRNHNNPFKALQKEVNKLFEDFTDGFSLPSVFSEKELKKLNPAMDIIDNDKSFKVEAELPGMSQEDIQVEINDHCLTIKGEKKTSKEDKTDDYVRRERYYGTYQRTISLPETADADQAKATFKKGVLSVEMPKKAGAVAKTRKLEIKAAA